MFSCPLCGSESLSFYHRDKHRDYWQCHQCYLVSVAPAFRLDAESEKSIYDLHENHPSDPGYRRFLARLTVPLMERIAPCAQGLDFGCGPGPTLSLMMEEQGFRMALYDIFYFPQTKALKSTYDFVTATEVIEHLHTPDQVWQQWLALVKPGGYIGIMTKLVRDVEAFAGWHYKNDLTHVSFFSQETFRFLAKRDNLEIEFIGSDVILLRKSQ
ncbi:class I SAM-dependent methyltransferase [Vibrio mangrovi]|uniref:Bifunctional 3-demethylubiquinone-9 3-methyltransferase/ 2-octaprenyl-6-hydroxy phenol methylase n=1 Tax=Vibrio mangrovi TaxID=474394 RepID=A0A1Y6J0U2_9VIBR|nr:class I SAM-dependent methyltransferase [Vibrio mangrovi]MDW6002564.1 class I SAM-dependent methyltransferase [Vibrio mangrovi]SMS01903.1 bifunctional 3-demethylubiquinone-9 3-methyltransferase/ 2-octaprenyl-6-hydroxy phenol methylase [Vibrio mangrovi]